MGWPWSAIEVGSPAWFIGLLLAPLVVYVGCRGLTGFSRRRQIASVTIRLILVVLVTLTLADCRIVASISRLFVVYAVDQSSSITERGNRKAESFLRAFGDQAGEDQSRFLSFARAPGGIETRWSDRQSRLDCSDSNLESALLAAAAALPQDIVPHIVLLSDGNQTEGDAVRAAQGLGLPVSTVPLEPWSENEVSLDALDCQGAVRPGEPLRIEATLRSNHADRGKIVLRCNGRTLAVQTVEIHSGENHVRFIQSLDEPGTAKLDVRLEGFRDSIDGNNVACAVVLVGARPRVMLIANEPSSVERLKTALDHGQFKVDVCRPNGVPATAEALRDYDAIVLVNVPAALLGPKSMEILNEYTKGGGGLIATGGDRSFVAGAYHGTPLEDALPVSSILEDDSNRPGLALVLVLDRSGSMKGTKMEMAKQAAARAIKTLRAPDEVGVLAFNERNEWIVEMARLTDSPRVLEAIHRLRADGQTAMYPAMEIAFAALGRASAKTKHMILLTDGLSTGGDFAGLAQRMAMAGVSVSTVALGDEAAGPLLAQIARSGRGHGYTCRDPNTLPEIFQLETAAASRQGIAEGRFSPVGSSDESLVPPSTIISMPPLLGYSLTRSKPTSQVVLRAEEERPLLAWWRYGRGRSAAFTSEAVGHWATELLAWPGYEHFWIELVRASLRKSESSGNVQAESSALVTVHGEEFTVRPANLELLQRVATVSGGLYDPTVAEILAAPRRTTRHTIFLSPYLVMAAMVVLLFDVTIRRTAWARSRPTDSHPSATESGAPKELRYGRIGRGCAES